MQSGAPRSRSVLTAELISSAPLVNWRWTSGTQVSKVWSTWTLRAVPGYSTRPTHLIWDGASERMIGIARRILDCMLLLQKRSHLSHEVLTTLMAEVTVIMNARPFKWKLSRMEPQRPFLCLLQKWFCFILQRLIPLINVGSLKTPSGECHAS